MCSIELEYAESTATNDVIVKCDDVKAERIDASRKTDEELVKTKKVRAGNSAATASDVIVENIGVLPEAHSSSESADVTPTRRNKRKMSEPRRRTTDFSIRSICQNSDSEDDNAFESDKKETGQGDGTKKVRTASIEVENASYNSQKQAPLLTADKTLETSRAIQSITGYTNSTIKTEGLFSSSSSTDSTPKSLGFGSPANYQNFMPLLYATGSMPSLWLYGSSVVSGHPLAYPFPIPSLVPPQTADELNHSRSTTAERTGGAEGNGTSTSSPNSVTRVTHPHSNLSSAVTSISPIPQPYSQINALINLSDSTSSSQRPHQQVNVSNSSLISPARTEDQFNSNHSNMSSPRILQQSHANLSNISQGPHQHSQMSSTPQTQSNLTFSPPDSPASTADDASSMASRGRSRKNYKNMTKQRRIEANARERTRVHTISAAFESLRRAVPSYSCNQRLSKLAILKIACNYILALANLAELDYTEDQCSISFDECVDLCTKTIQAEGKAKRKH